MPVDTEFRFEANLIIHRVRGEFGQPEFRSTLAEELSHPEFRPGMDALWNFSDADASQLRAEDIRAIAQHMRKFKGQRGSGYRLALVAPDDLSFGLSRMYEAQSAGLDREARVFRDEREAFAWLAQPRCRESKAQ